MSSTCSEYEHSSEAHNYGVQTFDKNYWYQVMGHLEKCAFETNAAIAQIGIRPY